MTPDRTTLARRALDALALIAGAYALPGGGWESPQRAALILDALDILSTLYQEDAGAALFPAWLRRQAEPLPGGSWGSGAAVQWIEYYEAMLEAYRLIAGRDLRHDAAAVRPGVEVEP